MRLVISGLVAIALLGACSVSSASVASASPSTEATRLVAATPSAASVAPASPSPSNTVIATPSGSAKFQPNDAVGTGTFVELVNPTTAKIQPIDDPRFVTPVLVHADANTRFIGKAKTLAEFTVGQKIGFSWKGASQGTDGAFTLLTIF